VTVLAGVTLLIASVRPLPQTPALDAEIIQRGAPATDESAHDALAAGAPPLAAATARSSTGGLRSREAGTA